MRKVLDVVIIIVFCVLWIDEIEKGLFGFSSLDRIDGGIVFCVFGIFFIWM